MLLLSKADLIGNVDADNFTGKGFSHYVRERFRENAQRVLTTFGGRTGVAAKDNYGRVVTTRKDAIAINGYNEKLAQYGGSDIDFAERIKQLGRETFVMEDSRFLDCIRHSDEERIKEMQLLQQLRNCYLAYTHLHEPWLLLLFHDHTFRLMALPSSLTPTPSAAKQVIDGGRFQQQQHTLALYFEQGHSWTLKSIEEDVWQMERDGMPFTFRPPAGDKRTYCLLQYMIVKTRSTSRDHANAIVNSHGWGEATVFRNFDYDHPLKVLSEKPIQYHHYQ